MYSFTCSSFTGRRRPSIPVKGRARPSGRSRGTTLLGARRSWPGRPLVVHRCRFYPSPRGRVTLFRRLRGDLRSGQHPRALTVPGSLPAVLGATRPVHALRWPRFCQTGRARLIPVSAGASTRGPVPTVRGGAAGRRKLYERARGWLSGPGGGSILAARVWLLPHVRFVSSSSGWVLTGFEGARSMARATARKIAGKTAAAAKRVASGASRKATAKKAPATKKAAATKAPAKKASPRPRPRRRPATKAPAKKAAAKKAPAKKAAGEEGRRPRRPREEGARQEGAREEGAGQEGPGEEGPRQEGSAPAKKTSTGRRRRPRRRRPWRLPRRRLPRRRRAAKKAPAQKAPAKKVTAARTGKKLAVKADEKPWTKKELDEVRGELQRRPRPAPLRAQPRRARARTT